MDTQAQMNEQTQAWLMLDTMGALQQVRRHVRHMRVDDVQVFMEMVERLTDDLAEQEARQFATLTTPPVDAESWDECPGCDGTGQFITKDLAGEEREKLTCSYCGGKGKIPKLQNITTPDGACTVCKGKGTTPLSGSDEEIPCIACQGGA